MKVKEVRIEETANRITEAFKKASEDAKKTVDALMTDDVKKKLTDDIITVPNGTPYDIIKKLAEYRRYIKELEGDKEILKAECADLKEENRQLKDSSVQTNNQLRVRDQEVIELKERLARTTEEREKADRTVAEQMKTISKMQQSHEAEVQDLKDQLGEAKAVEAAADKERALAIAEKNEYADALDNDSVAFEEILGLAILMERGAKSMHEVSKMIQAKTEGKV